MALTGRSAAALCLLALALQARAQAPGSIPQPADAADAADAADGAAPVLEGYLYGAATWRGLNPASNAGNPARVPLRQQDGAVIVDLRTPQLQLRVRASLDRRDTPSTLASSSGTAHTAAAELTQASWRLPLDGGLGLVIGRQNLAFDDGQSFHPLDFFEDIVRASDFEDRAGRARGFPMLMLERADASDALRLIYSDDAITDRDYRYGDPNPNFNRGLRQWVLHWRCSVGQLTFNLLARRSLPGTTGAGLSASHVLSASWSLHGAWYAERGNDQPIHRSLLSPEGASFGASDVYVDRSPWTDGRRDTGRLYGRWLMGASWTAESGDALTAELWHDDRGLTRSQRARWHRLIGFHRQLGHATARAVNVAYDLEALRMPQGTHLFLRWARPLAQGRALQASVLVAQDGGGSLSLRASTPLGAQWDASLEAWRRFGGAGTFNGSIPDRTGLQASVRYFF